MKSKLKKILSSISSLLMKLEPKTSLNDIQSSDDKEISYMHSKVHSLWSQLKDNKLKDSDWDRTNIINLHKLIVNEMIKKDFKHMYLGDLDDTLPSNLKDKTIQPNDGDKKDDS